MNFIETLIVLALIAVLSTAGVASFNLMRNSVLLQSTVDELVSSFRTVQKKVVSGQIKCAAGQTFDGILVTFDSVNRQFVGKEVCAGVAKVAEYYRFPTRSITPSLTISYPENWKILPVYGGVVDPTGLSVSPIVVTLGSKSVSITADNSAISVVKN